MTGDAPQRVALEVRRGIARVTLIGADRRNAIDPLWAREFGAICTELGDRTDVRVVILASTGPAFSVGGDVRFFAGSEDPSAALHALAGDLHRGLAILARMDAPLIACVQGVAAGAGMSLVLASDLAVAGRAASFTMAYTAVGLSPDGGSSYWLPRLVGHRVAMELMLTNRRVDALEAVRLGLVNEVVDAEHLLARTEEVAQTLAAGPTTAFGAVKRLLSVAGHSTYHQQLKSEADSIARCAASATGREGVAAFVAKRKPDFAGAAGA